MTNPLKVLIIDDEAMLRSSFRDYFEDDGATVLEAPNGAEGLDLCLRELPDLVLTDLRMPILDGFGVIEHLKQALPDIPIIVVSGQGTISDVITAIRMGAWDYITKPVLKLEEMSIVVQRVLERAKLLQLNRDYRTKLEQLLDDNSTYQQHLEELVHKRSGELKEAATKYKIVADHTHSWEFWINPQGDFIYSSPSCLRITGFPVSAFMANSKLLFELIHPDDKQLFMHHRHDSLEDRNQGSLEFRIIREDKGIRWIHHDCQPVFDEEGHFLGTRGSNRDITAQRQAEEAHLKSEQRLAAIFDFLPDATWAVDKQGTLIAWNKACQELTGVPAEKMLGRGNHCYAVPFYGTPRPMLIDFALNPTTEQLQPYLDGYTNFSIQGGNITAESSGLLLSKGRYLWWKAARLYDSEGVVTGAIESVRDITELRLAKEAAVASSRAKSAFLATMSHELRTPLNAVIGFTDLMLLKECGELNTYQEEYLNYILDSGKHLLALINDILDLSKIEAGKMAINCCNFSIRELLATSLTIFKERAQKHNLRVLDQLSERLPPTIWADALKLKQILFNLLSNAIKFTPSGGTIILSAAIETAETLRQPPYGRDFPDNSYLLVSISDTGIGIKNEDRQRIFQPFEQSDNSSTRQHEGTGLGLSLSKMMAELHGGTIWVETNPSGTGSIFYLVIPINPKTT